MFDYPGLGEVPSYELSFAIPAGLSGAPLFRAGSLDIAGVVYGSNDVAKIEEVVQVDTATGKRTPEVQGIISFGLAQSLESLARIRGPATGGRMLREVWR